MRVIQVSNKIAEVVFAGTVQDCQAEINTIVQACIRCKIAAKRTKRGASLANGVELFILPDEISPAQVTSQWLRDALYHLRRKQVSVEMGINPRMLSGHKRGEPMSAISKAAYFFYFRNKYRI